VVAGGDFAYDFEDEDGERGAKFLRAGEFLYSQVPQIVRLSFF